MLLAVLLDDYQELLVQRVAAVSASGGIILGGFFELVYPRFPGLFRPPCPAKLLELVGQFTARIGVNAFRRGERHLHLGEAAVAAEVGIAAIADVDDVLAGDLRHRAGPLASARLLRFTGLGLRRVTVGAPF